MSDQENKTEQASARRLGQAFEEGQVPIGRDAVGIAALACGVLALTSTGGAAMWRLEAAIAQAVRAMPQAPFRTLPALLGPVAIPLLSICAAAALASAVVTLLQTRGGFWPELAFPDLTRLFQPSRLTRLFKLELLTDLGMASVKVVAIGSVAYISLRGEFLTLTRMLELPVGQLLPALFAPLGQAVVWIVTLMAVIAGADLALTRRRFRKKMMMTKEEIKREHKDDEGDPGIRARRRRRHRELARARVTIEVPRADALVVNPTHVAVAIRYRKDEGIAPRVIAKGKGQLAEVMRELARSHAIPIVEDIPLARLLYRRVKVGGQIPAETFRAVAAVLAFVYRLVGRTPGQPSVLSR